MGTDVGEDFGTSHPPMGLLPDRDDMDLCRLSDQRQSLGDGSGALPRVGPADQDSPDGRTRCELWRQQQEASAAIEHHALNQGAPAAMLVIARTGCDEEVVPADFTGDGLFEKPGECIEPAYLVRGIEPRQTLAKPHLADVPFVRHGIDQLADCGNAEIAGEEGRIGQEVRQYPGHASREVHGECFGVSQSGLIFRRTIEVDCNVAIGRAANGLCLRHGA